MVEVEVGKVCIFKMNKLTFSLAASRVHLLCTQWSLRLNAENQTKIVEDSRGLAWESGYYLRRLSERRDGNEVLD